MTSERDVVVGVDAGGSSVKAVAERAGETIGRARGRAANPSTVGVLAAAEAIAASVREASGRRSIAVLYAGVAGAARRHVAHDLAEVLRQLLPEAKRIVIEHDARIALRSAIVDGPGIVLVAGTGSVAYAEQDARRAFAGGGGPLIGDEGSGAAIGIAVARVLLETYDGRRAWDDHTHALERALGVQSRDDLLDLAYPASGAPVPGATALAAAAPAVVALAANGHPIARELLAHCAAALARLAATVARRAGLEMPRVALVGGLLTEDGWYREAVRAAIAAILPRCSFAVAASTPERAALALAREAADEA